MNHLEVLEESLKRRFIANSVIKNIEETILKDIEEPLKKLFKNARLKDPPVSTHAYLEIVEYSVEFKHYPEDVSITFIKGKALFYRSRYHSAEKDLQEEAILKYKDTGIKSKGGTWVEADYRVESKYLRTDGKSVRLKGQVSDRVEIIYSNQQELEPDE